MAYHITFISENDFLKTLKVDVESSKEIALRFQFDEKKIDFLLSKKDAKALINEINAAIGNIEN